MKENNGSSLELHSDLFTALKVSYAPSGLIGHSFVKESESEEYGAFDFEMNGKRIKFRIGKITPTKIGQFTTLWKRIGKGPILPFDMEDPIDLFVINVRTSERLGQFVFPKTILWEKGIVSKDGKGGKRAMRIYPPWDVPDSRQAKNTQAWQLLYFFEIPSASPVDVSRVKKLFT